MQKIFLYILTLALLVCATPARPAGASWFIAPSRPAGGSAQNTRDALLPMHSASAKQLFQWVNQERARAGLAPYRWNEDFALAAALKCSDMVKNRYVGHVSPTYGTLQAMWAQLGLPRARVVENLAYHGTLEKAHAALMISEAHRRNVLSQNFTDAGIAVYVDAYGFVRVVEVFGRPGF
nr:CAP domain-containing protein [Maliibacterium massiliense]